MLDGIVDAVCFAFTIGRRIVHTCCAGIVVACTQHVLVSAARPFPGVVSWGCVWRGGWRREHADCSVEVVPASVPGALIPKGALLFVCPLPSRPKSQQKSAVAPLWRARSRHRSLHSSIVSFSSYETSSPPSGLLSRALHLVFE